MNGELSELWLWAWGCSPVRPMVDTPLVLGLYVRLQRGGPKQLLSK